MGLPIKNEEKKSKSIVLTTGRKIQITPWKVKQEKELLFAVDGMTEENNRTEIMDEVKKMLFSCVQDVRPDEVSDDDLLIIAAELRKQSKGDEIEFSFKCPSCKKVNPNMISISKQLFVKQCDTTAKNIGDLIVTFKPVSSEDTDRLKKNYTKMSEYNYQFLLLSIATLTYEGKTYKDFTIAELETFLDEQDSAVLSSLISELITASSKVYINKEVSCMFCKHKTAITFTDLYDFFVV